LVGASAGTWICRNEANPSEVAWNVWFAATTGDAVGNSACLAGNPQEADGTKPIGKAGSAGKPAEVWKGVLQIKGLEDFGRR
jgi:hypothetical protein